MRVLILGAGFGGLELATCLSEALGDQVAVTLIDKNDSFVFGFSKLDVMFGKQEPAAAHLPYRAIAKPGVAFRQETILSIDPERKRAVTDQGAYEGDVLVVTLGADLDPAATPGLVEGGHEFYSVAGAERLRDVLPAFPGGSVVVAVTTPHYKCPPAPSETAFLMHDYLVARGLRDTSRITLVMPFPTPLPVSPEVGAAIHAELTDRGIDFVGGATITGVDPGGRAVRLADGTAIDSDLILAVPLHVAPPVVVQAGLTEGGWIPVDKYTLADPLPGRVRVGRRRQRGRAPGGRLLRRPGQGGGRAAHRSSSVPSGLGPLRGRGRLLSRVRPRRRRPRRCELSRRTLSRRRRCRCRRARCAPRRRPLAPAAGRAGSASTAEARRSRTEAVAEARVPADALSRYPEIVRT